MALRRLTCAEPGQNALMASARQLSLGDKRFARVGLGTNRLTDMPESQVILAWLLQRSPVVVPIPGTLSLDHLCSNLAALDLELSDEDTARLERS